MSARPTFPTRSRRRRWRWRCEAHRLLGCRGASRSDFRWDDEQGVDGPLSARGQHPARHDAAEPGARAGAGIAASTMPSWSSGSWRRRYDARGSRAAAPRGARRAAEAARGAAAQRRARAASRSSRPACSNACGFAPGAGAADRAAGCFAALIVAAVIAAVARLPPAAAGRHRARRGRRQRRLHHAPGRDHAALSASRGSTIYNIAFDQPSMAMPLVDLDGDPRAAAALRLDPGGAGLAPPARHAGDRRRRARAGGDLAESAGG